MAMKTCLCENFGLMLKNTNGRHSQLFEKHKDALNLEILQVASSNLHKRYVARKASLSVILAWFPKQNGRHIKCFMSNGVILSKRPYISLTIARLRNVKTTYRRSWPENLFPGSFPFLDQTTSISAVVLFSEVLTSLLRTVLTDDWYWLYIHDQCIHF